MKRTTAAAAALALAFAVALAQGCGPGGTGTVTFNDLEIGDCTYAGDPLANPEDFELPLHLLAAERFGDALLIRLQDATSAAGNADGIYMTVGDVDLVTAGPSYDVGLDDNVEAVLYLLRTCPAGRPAVGLTGTVTFTAFEDRDGDGGPGFGDRIAGTLTATGFDDSNPEAIVSADLVATFDFVMRRGHPSQRFPTYDAIEVY
ncbi:MAG TPA: hypothetical protein VG389_05910 [Myxococcota bacterium]|jgi:hypothetical protein|nr:hypothetical protein [Myxococcota bacterium]